MTGADVLDDLVHRYGTPLYVYQLSAVRRAAHDLLAALPAGVELYYSAKANPHPALLRAVAQTGLGLEISSTGELTAVAAAGVPAGRSLYTGPAKTSAELRAAVAAGVGLFSVESPADGARLGAAAGTPVEYLIRLNNPSPAAAAGLRMTGTASQFGVSADTLEAGAELLRGFGQAGPIGWHLFSATNVTDRSGLVGEIEANIATAVRTSARTGFIPSIVDLGGGFGAPFAVPGRRPDYLGLRERLGSALDAALPGWRHGEPRLAFESGRHLVAEAGVLLTTVMDRKTSGGRTYVLCDAGVNALGGMSGLGRLLPPTVQPDGETGDPDADPVVLAGPLCTPLDVLSRRTYLKEPGVGDVLTVPNVGAYGLTASLVAFLGRPLPAEVVLDGDEVVSVRRLGLVDVGAGSL